MCRELSLAYSVQHELPLVREIMSSPATTVKVGAKILTAVKLMNKRRIGSVVVVKDGRPVGIVTERDLLRKVIEQMLDPKATIVDDVMS